MEFEQYKEGIKKRRAERLRLLRKKQRMNESPISFNKSMETDQSYSTFLDDHTPEERADHHHVYPLVVKIMLSILLAGGVYYILESDRSELTQAQSFVHDVFHREFNIAEVISWYEKQAEQHISFLPKITRRTAVDTPAEYVVPVNGGTVVSPFDATQRGIMVGTKSSLPIEVIKEGWVTFVGEKEGLGLTVVIDHGQGEESWYAHLQGLRVEEFDWVHQGQVIGHSSIDMDNGQGMFYFAMRKNSVFIDPLDVITFD